MYFKDFLRKMQNKVYFTETKPGFFEKNSKFKVKTNWEANIVKKWKPSGGEYAIKSAK